MSWFWQYRDRNGDVFAPQSAPVEEFGAQADAETWLGENWRTLLAVGVEQVSLYTDATVVYGPMSLRPEE